MVCIWSLRWMYPFFLFLFVCCFYVLTNMVLGFFSKMTWQCWAFPHKHLTFNGFVVLFKNLQIRVGRLFEKQFSVCNFKVTICVAPSRLMGRLGKVVAHERSTVYLKYHCRVFHLLCTRHYTSMRMNPRYSGKRNWRHRNGNQWYIRPSLKSKHAEAYVKQHDFSS